MTATRVSALVAAAASAMLLAGCVAEPTLPPGLQPNEFKALRAAMNERWWHSVFPDEPVPQVDPIEYVDEDRQSQLIEACLNYGEVGGVVTTAEDGYPLEFESEADSLAFERQVWVCAMSYPIAVDVPEEFGYYSVEQLGYLHDYFTMRTVPCLELQGYQVGAAPSREEFVDRFYENGYWLPYYQTLPPIHDAAWRQVGFACPPPPLGEWYLRFLP